MKDALNIGGKIYISSRRAAEISKYSNDYVGQLCRGGKVPATMMGRTWFVDQQALLDHKKAAEEAFQVRGRAAVYRAQVLPAIEPAGKNLAEAISLDTPLGPPRLGSARPASSRFIAKQFGMKKAVLAGLMILVLSGGVFAAKETGVISRIIPPGSLAQTQTATIIASLKNIGALLREDYDSAVSFVAGLFSPRARGLAERDLHEPAVSQSAMATSSWNGVAVVPSNESDQQTEQRIRDSFSDEVNVAADESGTAGIITPVFRKTSGDDFLYVLVPVKDATAATSTSGAPTDVSSH